MRLKFTKSLFVLIISVFLTFGLFEGSFSVYQKFQQSQEKFQQTLSQLELSAKQSSKEAEEKVQELNSILSEQLKGKQKDIQALRVEINAQQSLINNKEPDLPDIISQWSKIISSIKCDFHFEFSGEPWPPYQINNGSGIMIWFEETNNTVFVTNKHILTDKKGYGPYKCELSLANHQYQIFNKEIFVDYVFDFGILMLENPDLFLSRVHNESKDLKFCNRQPLLGEKIVILGYPGIGSKLTINATEGIISGFENNMDYFVTSAKVEQGNSGGAAILVKDNCLLGIPTFAEVGEIESLARILNINRVFNR